MKVFHRIRRYLIPLLLFILHCATALSPPPAPDFTKCNIRTTGSLRCLVHKDCAGGTDENDYIQAGATRINAGCQRYLLVRAKTLHEVEIEFRDDTMDKPTGVEIRSEYSIMFKCVNNKASSTVFKSYIKENSGSSYNGLFCKFKVADQNKNVIKLLQDQFPQKIVGKASGNDAELVIGPANTFEDLFVSCDWSELTQKSNQDSSFDNKIEETTSLVLETSKMTCPNVGDDMYFSWFKAQGNGGNKWEKIGNDFTCKKGKIEVFINQAWKTFEETPGDTKCTRPRCSICKRPEGVCTTNSTADPTKPEFKATDGESCAKIVCSTKHMLVDTGSGLDAYPGNSLDCSSESTSQEEKWTGGISKIKSVSCVKIISCNQLHPMRSDCTKATNVGKDMICTNATLKDDGTAVCGGADEETWFQPTGGLQHKFDKFKCNSTSGRWKGEPQAVDIVKNSNVYCLSKAPPPETKPKVSSAMTGGKIIAIIVGVALVVAAIVVIVILCMRRRIKKKGNRDEMKSVSVTGRLDKNSKKKKKGKSSSSKTSEISAPPPPPCPDSLNLPNEPEPVPPPSGPPSSGPAPVGPDTGKPDKPAELIDIKLESEKKNDVSSKKEEKAKDADATVANTVTGTGSFGDKPTTTAAGKDNKDATDTKKDKNGESARSDTGKTGTKDTTKKMKNKKIQLDKNGRGMTDDDDYKIDENAKPVNHEDKNKKPYAPAVDPRKKMINVTMTEDDEGHMKPKGKKSLF